ncbi:DNA glycosylase AlkZ-like family protein [Spirilliplanes yamanashiensis]|uniref:Winged helix DNA-binding domain-containing protein n=1 Tax=Spirilliplanes yamanashiensis TaxID=42233 RepID=A0A8J3Y8R2_9ACTN|nr:crosslink repair DNA glycosylase YcaQ family protein [Spirilliplanes yamanashiensis]MDP9815739.1 hypothetical protein [Spirilliplanes yamanashiensis]GIJ03993.1 hypothetical protein Sya03_33450 [Spirilliplanes yamanashiensis]
MRTDRSRVMAYRIAAHELHRADVPPSRLRVLDLGVQDAAGSARLALAARTTAPLDDDELVLVWATRGAPHLLRRADVPALAAALWPVSDADATARIATNAIKEGARLGLAAFTAAAQAMRDVVTGPVPRGEVSTAVTARIPDSLSHDCVPCGARHVSGALFQQVGIFAGVSVEPRRTGAVLAPLPDRPPVPAAAHGTAGLIRSYLELHGPASPADAAAFLGSTRTALKDVWPDGLAEVDVDGRRGFLPEDALAALRDAPEPDMVRLLPPMDPLLQGRDRDVLVPVREHQKALWRIIANPGAVLVGADIAGTWRARLTGRRLAVTVTPFARPAKSLTAAVEREAGVLAAARGAADVTVTVED